MTGTQVAHAIIGAARGRRDIVEWFYESAARLDEAAKGADAYAAELRAELMLWLDRPEFPTYTDAQGREHADF